MQEILGFLGGGLGGLVGPIMGFFAKRDEHKQALAMRELDIKELSAEAEANVKVAAETTRGKEVTASWGAFRDSYKADSFSFAAGHAVPKWAAGLLTILDLIRGLVRPVLTFLLVAVLIRHSTVGANMESISSMAFIAVGWFFGARSGEKHLGGPKVGDGLRAWGVAPGKVAEMVKNRK